MECFGLEAGLKVAFLRPDKRDAFVFGGDDNIFVGSTAYNLGSKLMRALARDSASVFNDVQKMLKSEKSGRNTSLSNFLNASRKYRSLINACVRNFCEEETPDEDTAAMGAVMLKIDFVWHLTEILYLETGSGQLSLLRDLRDWVQLHMSEKRVDLVSDVMEFETNDDDSLAEDHPKYWDAVHYALLHLDFPTVQDLLGQHSLRSEPAFTEAVELLTEAHKLVTDRIDRATAEQFIVERAALKANCQTLLKSGHFLSYPQLAFIPKLLCGNLAEVEDVLLRFPMHIDWYELLPAVLLFDFTSRPTVEDVPNAVEMCLRLCRMGERGTELRPVDLILISFAKLNRKKGIDQSAAGFNNCWFLAHWTDLMYRAGTLGFMDEKDAKRYRQQFVLDYALQLIDENLSNMSSAHFWTIAMNYLDKSDQYSRRMLENRLLRLPLQNERAVLRLLQISQQEGMQEVALTLCRVKCRESASKGQYYAAILWAMRCGEASTIALATREFVRALVQESSRENLTSLDKIDIPAAWTAVSPDLAFLANYREFCFYKRQMKHADALNVLVNMMKSSHVPSLFRPILNSDAVMLMNEESARFTVEDIESIMRYVDKSGQMRQQQKHGSCGASLATVRKTLLKKYETLADSS